MCIRDREGTEQTAFNLGRATEINRDEVKFGKYITKLRHRFSHLFTDLLKIQLLLTGVINEEDWFDIKDNLDYVWTKDSHFAELKNNEILRERFEILAQAEEYIGKYISNEWVKKNILQQTDEEIKTLAAQIEAEKPEEEDELGGETGDIEDF